MVDLVETGTTMREYGMDIVHVIMESQTVLIKNPNAKHPSKCDPSASTSKYGDYFSKCTTIHLLDTRPLCI